MNRKSTIRLLKSGKKVTHLYFEPDEWIKLKGDQLVDEDGINIGTLESFIEGADMSYENDWKEYKI